MAKRLSRNLLGLLASVATITAAPLLGIALTAVWVRRAFQDTATADPAHKARLLAEGISSAMNATVVGVVLGALAIPPAIVFGVRLHRESRSKGDSKPPIEPSHHQPL